MTSRSDTSLAGAALVLLALVIASACGLDRPPDPPPFDCANVDRAAERFPARCADASEPALDGGLEP